MWSFFHSWRRNAGCVALCALIAIAFLWVRSIFVWDHLLIVQGDNGHRLYFDSGGFVWAFDRGGWGGASTSWHWGIHLELTNQFTIIDSEDAFLWTIRDTEDQPYLLVYYWQLLLPLTLLSAYLLLWKPRKAKSSGQPAISNLISN